MLKFHVDYISHSGKKLRSFFGFWGSGPGSRANFSFFLSNCFFTPLWLFGFQKYGISMRKSEFSFLLYYHLNLYPIPNRSENITVYLNLHH